MMTWANPDLPEMSTAVRARWVRTLYPDVEVEASDAPPDAVRQAFTEAVLPGTIDAVFTSEGYGDTLADRLGAEPRRALDVPEAGVN